MRKTETCNMLIPLMLTIILIFIYQQLFPKIEAFQGRDKLYEKLMNGFQKIFPDMNRNGGGIQFYHHIVTNLKPTKQEYLEYNQFYCGVSGSPIDPQRQDRFHNLVVNDLQGKQWYGKYYRCCWPCVCDIMKYVKVEPHTVQLKDGAYSHYVLTIGDPCRFPKKIPTEVTSFKCQNNQTTNSIRTKSGRLIIAVLYDAVPLSSKHQADMKAVNELCKERNQTPPDQLYGGMGDIFVKLALINP